MSIFHTQSSKSHFQNRANAFCWTKDSCECGTRRTMHECGLATKRTLSDNNFLENKLQTWIFFCVAWRIPYSFIIISRCNWANARKPLNEMNKQNIEWQFAQLLIINKYDFFLSKFCRYTIPYHRINLSLQIGCLDVGQNNGCTENMKFSSEWNRIRCCTRKPTAQP